MARKNKVTVERPKEGSEDQKKAAAMRKHVLSQPLGPPALVPKQVNKLVDL